MEDNAETISRITISLVRDFTSSDAIVTMI